MPAPETVDEMIELIRRSKLIESAKLDAYLVTHQGPYTKPKDLLGRMQADGLLTPFQSEQLLRGKHRGYFLGKYKILDRIGMGGMGQVFLAEHLSMRRRVALKVLPPDRANDEFKRERFLREARAAGQLDHPNLVRAFDVDTQDDVIYLIMEYVDGINLHDLVARHGPLDPHRAAYYTWQTAHGLSYMESQALIHRDIKPANLLLDRVGMVKILDLGLVRSQVDHDNLTQGEGVKTLGTADYLAPEQAINASTVDIRADIYSLGATTYYLLTGRPLFTMEQLSQKLIAHQMKPITPIRKLRPEVPAELASIIEQMLAKKPEDRPQHPSDVVRMLEPWAVTPPQPPSEIEIPASVGGFGVSAHSVNLSANLIRANQLSASHPGSVSSSGSGLRYHSDRMKESETESGARPPVGPSSSRISINVPSPLPLDARSTASTKAASTEQTPMPRTRVDAAKESTPPPKPAPIGLNDLFVAEVPPNIVTPVKRSVSSKWTLTAICAAVAVVLVGGVILFTGSDPTSPDAGTTSELSPLDEPEASAL